MATMKTTVLVFLTSGLSMVFFHKVPFIKGNDVYSVGDAAVVQRSPTGDDRYSELFIRKDYAGPDNSDSKIHTFLITGKPNINDKPLRNSANNDELLH